MSVSIWMAVTEDLCTTADIVGRGLFLLECVWEGSEVVACISAVGRAGSIYTRRYPDRLSQPDPRTLRDWSRQP